MKKLKILILSANLDQCDLTQWLWKLLETHDTDPQIGQRTYTPGAISQLQHERFNLVLVDLDKPLTKLDQLVTAARANEDTVILGLERAVRHGADLTYPRCAELGIDAIRSDQPIADQACLIRDHLRETRAVVPTSSLIKPNPLTKYDQYPSPSEMVKPCSMGRRIRSRAT